MTPDREAFHDLELRSVCFQLCFAAIISRILDLDLFAPFQVAAAGDEPVTDSYTRDLMLPADMAPSLLAKAASSDAVLAPASVRHMCNALLCHVCGAGLDRVDGYLKVRGLLLGFDLCLALLALCARFGVRFVFDGRRNQSSAYIVHTELPWTRRLT